MEFHNGSRNVTKRVTKCRGCKRKFKPPARGRKPLYCSRACRQKAYRARLAKEGRPALKALQSDLWAIKDRTARKNAAIRVLHQMGYAVHLERIQPLPDRPPNLRLVSSSDEEQVAKPPRHPKPK